MNEEELLKKYRKLVRYYAYSKRGKNVDIDDLVQGGYIGLITAAKKYDESKGSSFSTYASVWIKSEILDVIYSQSKMIRVSNHFLYAYYKIINEKEILQNKINREPTILEISSFLDIPVSKVQEIIDRYNQTIVTCLDSAYIEFKYYNKLINQYLSENEDLDEDDISIDMFVNDNQGTPEDIFNEKFNKQYLSLKLKKLFIDCNLNEREIEILKLRYGFYGKTRTLQEIGQLFGLTRERIRQIEEKAFKKIKDSGLISSVDTFLSSFDETYYNLEEKTMKLKK